MLLLFAVPGTVKCEADTVGEAQSLIDGIVGFQLNRSGDGSVQEWIDGALAANAGTTSEWYILGLSQSRQDYRFTTYETALQTYLAGTNTSSAVSRQKYALALISTGSCDGYITETLGNSIGQQGIMSWVYGLHLLNNGYTSEAYTTGDIVHTLLSLQLDDGGWALTGTISDVDVTAMTVQALAPYYAQHSAAMDRAVSLLSERQREGGDYASYGVPNPESTAQVITALSALGIDCMTDPRFIKNGNTLLDGLAPYRLADGSFSHKAGGSYNHMATAQVFYAMIAYTRQQNGWGSLYLLDQRDPAGLSADTPDAPTEPPQIQTDAPAVSMTEEPAATTPASTASVTDTAASETTTQTSTSVTSTETETETTTSCTERSTAASEAASETTVTETTAAAAVPAEETGGGYKLPVCLVIAAAGGAVCLVLFLMKKRHPKNFIAVLIVSAAAIAFVLLTDFQSAEEYYHKESTAKENSVGTVTMTIRCDTVAGAQDTAPIPEDGILLDETVFAIAEGDTVFDVLTEAAQTYGIQMEYNGTADMAYICGIGYLYEFDYGALSGWVYHVNGEEPSVGCGEYVLRDGDAIAWLYTCDLGNDVRQ